MKKTKFKNFTEELFEYFEENIEFSGEYLSQTTNAVLAFDNWIDTINFGNIASIIPELREEEFEEFIGYIHAQIEHYLLRSMKL